MHIEVILTRREMAGLFFAAMLHGEPYSPRFFSTGDFEALERLTEILIPTDETPGAKDARCAQFIDFVLDSSGAFPETQITWRRALADIKDTGFYTAAPNRQLEIVGEMARPETDPSARHPAFFAYRLIKKENAFAFYTSKMGTMDVLDYKGNSYNLTFPGCQHREHQTV